MFWLFLPAGFSIFYIIHHLIFKRQIDTSYRLITRWLDKHQSNVNTLRNLGVLGFMLIKLFRFLLLPIVFIISFLLFLPIFCVIIYCGTLGFVVLFAYIFREVNIESAFYVLIFNLGVILSVGILIHKYVSNYERSVSWKACFFPVLLFFVLSLLSYYVRIDSGSKDWFCWPFELYQNNKDIWEFLTPHITGAVGFVTFWAFWAQLKANKLASDDSKKTSIENTFFQMLTIHRQNLSDINKRQKSSKFIGKKAVSNLCDDLIKTKRNNFKSQYKAFYDESECFSEMATYFYHLYRMVKYIDSQKVLTLGEKKDYMKNLRAQMSREEQTLLFHNWLAGYLLYDPKKRNEEYGYKWETDKQPYLSRYNLIVHLEPEKLLPSARDFVSKNTWEKDVFKSWEKHKDHKSKKWKSKKKKSKNEKHLEYFLNDYGIDKNDKNKKSKVIMKVLFKNYKEPEKS